MAKIKVTSKGKTTRGTLIGAAVGGIPGAMVGNYLSRNNNSRGMRDFGQSFLDPFDISGQRARGDEKAYQKAQAAEERRRKEEVKKLVKQAKKVEVKKVAGITQDVKKDAIMKDKILLARQAQAQGDVDRLRQMGQSGELTPGAQRELARQRLEEQTNLENIQGQQAQQAAQQFSNLASQGGAEAGSRERLFGQLGGQSLREQQMSRRQGALDRMGISSKDEATKLGLLQNLPGQQLNVAQERRAGLTQDQGAILGAMQGDQAMQANQYAQDFGVRNKILDFQFGNLGAEQLARQQAAQAAQARKSGPLGQRGGFMGGGYAPDLFGVGGGGQSQGGSFFGGSGGGFSL